MLLIFLVIAKLEPSHLISCIYLFIYLFMIVNQDSFFCSNENAINEGLSCEKPTKEPYVISSD